MKPYYCHIEEKDINYLKTTNNLIETSANKPATHEISMPFDYTKL